MRNVRRVLLFAFGLIAGMAFVPSVTSAQPGVELEREEGGACPALTAVGHLPTDTGCTIHAVTEPGTTVGLYQHVAGVGEIPFTQCSWEFEAAFDGTGAGFIYNQVLTPEGAPCGREVCDEGEGGATPHRNLEWPARIYEAAGGGERINLTFCLYAHSPIAESEGTQGTPCNFDLAVNRIGHAYELATLPINPALNQSGSPCTNLGGVVELVGHWVSAPPTPRHRGFMVHHLN
jgi:hypothetical protein